MHHRDPFDRLLMAQSIEAGGPVITANPWFARVRPLPSRDDLVMRSGLSPCLCSSLANRFSEAVSSQLKPHPIIRRGPISRGHGRFIQPQIYSELRAVMHQVIEEHLPVG